MNVEVKSESYDWKRPNRIYVTSNLTEATDKFFEDQKIRSMIEKSEVWSKISRRHSRLINSVIKKSFGCERSMYSRYAGCSCPCSPGFVVKGGEFMDSEGKRQGFHSHSVCIEVTASGEELKEFTDWMDSLVPDLLAEQLTPTD